MELRPFDLPLRVRFRGLTSRRGCLIRGERGWGEFAPFDDYDRAADARWLRCALEQADQRWPAPVRTSVPVNAIIAAVDPDRAVETALSSGCTTIKIKVGDPGGYARVRAIREAMPDADLRVDVNGGWDLQQAIAELRRLRPLGLQYAEQPVRSFADMGRLRDAVDVPLAADELIRVDRRFDDIGSVADVAILKVPTLGGVTATLEVASRLAVPVVISSALDTSLGLAAGLAAACALPAPPLACGLGTGALFGVDTTEPLVPQAGIMHWRGYPEPAGPALPHAVGDLEYWRQRIAG